MENLFYNRSISQRYDLKGSLRNRYTRNAMENSVLLDENLTELMYASPICINAASKVLFDPTTIERVKCVSAESHTFTKALLTMAIYNDTLFLSSLNVMDYSLLVGFDSSKNEIVVGIIGESFLILLQFQCLLSFLTIWHCEDYMRRYTWDKRVETALKSAVGPTGKVFKPISALLS